MKRIPYRLLTDCCILRIYRREGIYGRLSLISEERLSRVHISFSEKSDEDRAGHRRVHKGCIIYDCFRSIPKNAAISAENCVSTAVINGTEYRITDIKYRFELGKMHHIEMKLGGME